MSSRERILGRVRRALADAPSEDTPIERAYLREHGDRSVEETVELLAENLADYRAIVHRCTTADLPATLAGMLAARGSKTVLVPPGLERSWLAEADTEQVPDRVETTPHELDRIDSVVTACAVAVAETGTIVLDGGPDQGRRRITLVPDHHIC
ncbi:MAG: LUD domain-containing protein, partial [Streptomyces sp.]|nr:LUD domain-containing protein [Streptomyces sp.]